MEVNEVISNRRIDVNDNSNYNCNISKVIDVIKNKKEARWFCQQNS